MNPFELPKCPECGALGTAVENRLCCRVRQMANEHGAKFRAWYPAPRRAMRSEASRLYQPHG